MLISLLYLIIAGLINLLNLLLPEYSLPQSPFDTVAYYINSLKAWNELFPVYEFLALLAFIVLFECAILLVRYIGGLFSYIRPGKIDI